HSRAMCPRIGDTKERLTDNARVLGSLQYERKRLIVGGDVAYNTIDSKYYGITMGERSDYAHSSGQRGDVAASGEGTRVNGALFAQYTLQPAARVRLSLGARYDWLSDDFEPRSPSEG